MPNVTTHTPATLGVHTVIADGRERNATLTALECDLITALLGRPSIVVVGMAYDMQSQLAAAFRRTSPAPGGGCWAIGIEDAIGGDWDADSPLQRSFLGPPASTVVLDEVFVADSYNPPSISETKSIAVTLTNDSDIAATATVGTADAAADHRSRGGARRHSESRHAHVAARWHAAQQAPAWHGIPIPYRRPNHL